jgi:cytochrome P450
VRSSLSLCLSPTGSDIPSRATSDDQEREKARKFLAPAFSNLNLQKSAPLLQENIQQVFQVLDSYDQRDEPVEMGQVILDLIIGTLTKSSFEVDFNLSTHSHPSTATAATASSEPIDSASFLHELEVLVKERMLQLVIPLRFLISFPSFSSHSQSLSLSLCLSLSVRSQGSHFLDE